jgi:NHLM bacteriocin system ABC transporter ATP-binding protein
MSGAIRLDGDAVVVLPPGDTPLLVEEGEVEVYLAGPERRRLVAVVRAGQHVFPLACPGPPSLVLAASAPAALEPDEGDLIASARLWTALHDGAHPLPADPAVIVPHLQAWTESLDPRFAAEDEARDRATTARLAARDGDGPTGDALTDELRWLVEQAGSELPVPAGTLAGANAESLPARARTVGVRLRGVTLAPDWPRADAGPLLLRADGGERIVAAAWRRGRYLASDGTGIDAAESQRFDRRAWVLHLPFDRPVGGVIGLARFALRDLIDEPWPRIGAALGLAAIGLVTPIATGLIVDEYLPAGEAGLLAATGAALVAVAVFAALLQAVQGLAMTRVDGRNSLRLAAALGDHVLRLPAAFFRTLPAGDFNQRLQSVEAMRGMLVGVLFSVALTALFAIAYFGLLFSYDLVLALIGLGLTLIHVGAVLLSRIWQMEPLRRSAVLDGRLAGFTYEMLEAIAKLRTAAAEQRAMSRWNDIYARERIAGAQGELIGNHFAVFSAGYQIAVLMVLFAAAVVLTGTRLSAGTFIAFLVGFGLFQASFIALCDRLLQLYSVQPLAERAVPILTAAPESRPGRADPGRLSGAIDVSNLLFGYEAGAAPLIDGLSFRLAPGEHLAIVGASGSGKSTVLRLLLGFESPRAGSITYDGQELAHLDLARLRGQIGVVLQNSLLFQGTILENIRGVSGAGLEQCLEAARQAGLGADLEQMGMGIHTPITEGGGTFSGGQKQRILVARALAADPRILFLDEATSALDNVTQAIVAATMDSLDATRITIAHRLSTVRRANRIGVLKQGRFVECGSFEELMESNGEFAALARRQLLED